MAQLRFTILGCGSSAGVPRIGNNWGDCDPANPKNARRRCSLLIERIDGDGTTRILIDSTPDVRQQLIDAGVGALDGVVYTHPHADHIHGIDDLRVVVLNMQQRLPVWADANTRAELLARFAYCFAQPKGSAYPPILEMNLLDGPVTISGAGGAVTLTPFAAIHGRIEALGFRINDLAYLPDVSEMTDAAWQACRDLDCWIIDALRRTPHPSHTHLARTLEWIDHAAPRRAVLTNMHIDLDYETVRAETPDNVTPGFDGMQVSYEV
ncbi:MAG: MBL fold metallo-hydrolase [Rhodobacteraceae bacterium]|nr:MBL fold metallo-hydrolase [Paracoccaceae bacterium]